MPTREHAPFWAVDVTALLGLIVFVLAGKLAPEWGIAAMMAIVGFGTGTRTQLAAARGAVPPSLPPPPNGGIATVVFAMASFAGRHSFGG